MPTVLLNALTVAATVIGVLIAVPQLVRLLRTRSAAGLSLPGWVAGSLSYIAWSGYLFAASEGRLLVATVPPAILWVLATALVAVLGADPAPRMAWRTTALWGTALLVLFATAPLAGLGLLGGVLALSSVWSYTPQAWHAWTCPNPSGISATTWLLATLEGITFAAIALDNPVAVVYGAVAATLSAVILTGRLARRPRPVPDRRLTDGPLPARSPA